ncbi:hypothetical protein V8F33_003679 [Rhypophila sp. PSN 637]
MPWYVIAPATVPAAALAPALAAAAPAPTPRAAIKSNALVEIPAISTQSKELYPYHASNRSGTMVGKDTI